VSTEGTQEPATAGSDGRKGLTRKELYELVWSEPVQAVAERFGMSDRGLAKLCERHAIPTPGRGYWRQKETGHPARRLPLPTLHPTHQRLDTVQLPEPQVIVQPAPKPEPPPDPPRVAVQRAFEDANPIVVGDLPDRPHPSVRATRAGLRKLKEGSSGRMRASGDLSLNVAVTAATRDRGLRIVEAMCRAFKQRGWPVTAHQGDHRDSQVEVHGVKVAFSLEERLRQQERPKPKPIDRLLQPSLMFQERYEYIPTGELVLRAWHTTWFKSKWGDGKRQRVEEKLNDFMITVVTIADAHIRWKEEQVVQERRRLEEEKVRWERQRRQEEEDRRGKDLAQLAERWREAEALRVFIAAVRARFGTFGDAPQDTQLERWLLWVDGYAGRKDPLNHPENLPPPFLRRSPWSDEPAVEWPPA
jgi:hypothetical protein